MPAKAIQAKAIQAEAIQAKAAGWKNRPEIAECAAFRRGGSGEFMSRVVRFARLGGLLAGLCLVLALTASAVRAESPSQVDPPFHFLRYQDDFSNLARKSDPTPWERLKYIPLGASGYGPIFLSLGGELRERHESYVYPNFGVKAPARDGYMLERFQLNGDLHVTDFFRAFVQLGDDRIFGRRGYTSTTDVDRWDLMQRFVDLRLPSPFGDDPTLRYGREELLFGYQRLVAVREGPNVRRAFDGFRINDKIGEASVDFVVAQPVVNSPYAMDDTSNAAQHLAGLYVTTPVVAALKADFYNLAFSNAQAKFRGLTGAEKIDTTGTRLFGKADGFDWNFEASVQTGAFRTQKVDAYMLAAVAGYTLEDLDWKPRFGFSANDISGDNANSKTIGVFNPMFPRLPYFAETPLMVPANIRDVRPLFSFAPVEHVGVVMGWDMLWRSSLTDGTYGSGMTEYVNSNKATSRRLGDEASIDVRWQVDPYLQLGAILAQLYAGPAMLEAAEKSTTYAVLFAKFKF